MVVSIPDRLGGLHDILEVVAECKLNMASIESRPSTTPKWDYDFFIEFENASEAAIAQFEKRLHDKNFGEVHTFMSSEASKDQGSLRCFLMGAILMPNVGCLFSGR